MDDEILPSREKAAIALKNDYNDKVLKVAFGNALKQVKQERNKSQAASQEKQVVRKREEPVD